MCIYFSASAHSVSLFRAIFFYFSSQSVSWMCGFRVATAAYYTSLLFLLRIWILTTTAAAATSRLLFITSADGQRFDYSEVCRINTSMPGNVFWPKIKLTNINHSFTYSFISRKREKKRKKTHNNNQDMCIVMRWYSLQWHATVSILV